MLLDSLTQLFIQAKVEPAQIRQITNTFLMRSEPMSELIEIALNCPDHSWVGESILAKLNSQFLFNALQYMAINNYQIEKVLTDLRYFLLINHENLPKWCEQYVHLNDFMASLAMQCLNNDFVYYQHEDETLLSKKLYNQLDQTSDVSTICLVGCYYILGHSDHTQSIISYLELQLSTHMQSLLRKHISEPLTEIQLRKTIKTLSDIDDDVSLKVEQQYIQHPYPRWEHIVAPPKADLNGILLQRYPYLKDQMPLVPDKNVDILIAGCGTGRHPIAVSQHYISTNILSIDLSKTSLAYAMRKTQEMGITNIEYMHADILKLGQLNRTFDVIESAGVLHHMHDPVAGWRVLSDLLKPRGLMRIGLYSKHARKNVSKARDYIKQHGYNGNDHDIRKFRHEILASKAAHPLWASSHSSDFYTLSECRDLLFHVQEHQFDIPQIKDILDELDFEFFGFDLTSYMRMKDIAREFDTVAKLRSLDAWDEFERNYPDMFKGMYQFWIRKKF